MQLGVDNATVLDLGYQGLGRWRENHHVGPMHPEYFAPAPDRARPGEGQAMMAEAGHADTELELISLDDDINRNTCDAVAAQLRDAGIKREADGAAGKYLLEQLDSAIPSRPPSGTCGRSGCRSTPSPTRPAGPWNETAFADPEFDDLLDRVLCHRRRRQAAG